MLEINNKERFAVTVIEDDEAGRLLLKRKLENSNFEISLFTSASDFIEYAKENLSTRKNAIFL